MMLRYLVSQWVRQAARQKLMEAVGQAAARTRAPGEHPPPRADAPCRLLVAFALGIEAGGLVDLLKGGTTTKAKRFVEHVGVLDERRLAVLETGVGREQAAAAMEDAIALHQPDWVVSAGFAGALMPQLHRGHILMADHVADLHGLDLAVGLKLDPQSLGGDSGLHTGRLLTVDGLVRTRAEREQLAVTHEAVACDMESSAVADVCRRAKVRFLSVRTISDAIDDELPPEIERLLMQKSAAAKLGAATGAIFQRPSSVKEMWKLQEQAVKASDRLARFLVSILPTLGADRPAG